MNKRFGKSVFLITTVFSMIITVCCKNIPKVTPGVDQGIYTGYFLRLYVNQEILLDTEQSCSFVFKPDMNAEPDKIDFAIEFPELFMTDKTPDIHLQGFVRITDLSEKDPMNHSVQLSKLGMFDRGSFSFITPDTLGFRKGHQYQVDLFLSPVENIPENLKKAYFQVRVRKYPGAWYMSGFRCNPDSWMS